MTTLFTLFRATGQAVTPRHPLSADVARSKKCEEGKEPTGNMWSAHAMDFSLYISALDALLRTLGLGRAG